MSLVLQPASSQSDSQPTLASSGSLNVVLRLVNLGQGFRRYTPLKQRAGCPLALTVRNSESLETAKDQTLHSAPETLNINVMGFCTCLCWVCVCVCVQVCMCMLT